MKFDIKVDQCNIYYKVCITVLTALLRVLNFGVSTANMRRVISSYKQVCLQEWHEKNKFFTVFLRITPQYTSAGLSEDFNVFNILWPRTERVLTCIFQFWPVTAICINPLNTKRRLLYLKTQFVPRSKHYSSRL
jgi:hypothetical protein